MELGMVGLGRMGGNMVRRIVRGGHVCVVHDRVPARAVELAVGNVRAAGSLAELAQMLAKPRAVWLMLPAGDATEETIRALSEILEEGDAVIDGGNTHFKDDVRRAALLAEKKIAYVDVGTSGHSFPILRS